MTTIYLIRHAEAEGNLYRIAQGQNDSNLTDRGWRQVRALERRFASIPIDAVYASDLYRTCATASAIYRPKGLPLHRETALREIGVGEWEGRTWGDIYRRDPELMEAFSRHMDRWHIAGAETAQQVLDRVRGAVARIAAENDGRTVAVVSHGYAIRLLLAWAQGLTLEETGATPHGDNTAVSLLEAGGGTLRVLFRDDNSHLKTPEFLAEETPIRRQNALEPGLWFEPLEGRRELLHALAEEGWRDSGRREPFDPARLEAEAESRWTRLGFLNGEPVGLVQMGPDPGWITLACIRSAFRKRGFGTQLIGQAVQHTRREEGETLYAAAPMAAKTFLRESGFVPSGTGADGRTLWEKSIAFDPEIRGW